MPGSQKTQTPSARRIPSFWNRVTHLRGFSSFLQPGHHLQRAAIFVKCIPRWMKTGQKFPEAPSFGRKAAPTLPTFHIMAYSQQVSRDTYSPTLLSSNISGEVQDGRSYTDFTFEPSQLLWGTNGLRELPTQHPKQWNRGKSLLASVRFFGTGERTQGRLRSWAEGRACSMPSCRGMPVTWLSCTFSGLPFSQLWTPHGAGEWQNEVGL